jgi:alkanesulfonate monooxygenase SsuD/methylene tetrahydromethanopterin reductase-like flavin-dependent oxidoreductase (luciferase family)
MQFYTFDETTYPGIPDHVGPESKLTNRFCDPALAAQTYREHLDEWAICEDLGFDGALVNEHHFTYFNINPSCTVLAAALIMRTKGLAKIKLALACYTPNPLILEGCQWN